MYTRPALTEPVILWIVRYFYAFGIWNTYFIIDDMPMENKIIKIISHGRAALADEDQLMSSPPFWLMSSWTRGFKNKYSLFSLPVKKGILTDRDLLRLTWLFHFEMCLYRWKHIYIYIMLSILRNKGQYNAQHCLYTLGIVNKTCQW